MKEFILIFIMVAEGSAVSSSGPVALHSETITGFATEAECKEVGDLLKLGALMLHTGSTRLKTEVVCYRRTVGGGK